MTIDQINAAIIAGKFTNDDLDSIVDSLKLARARIARNIKNSLSVGDNVAFSSRGIDYKGYVTKIAVKNVTVRTGRGLFRVPAALLTVVEDLSNA